MSSEQSDLLSSIMRRFAAPGGADADAPDNGAGAGSGSGAGAGAGSEAAAPPGVPGGIPPMNMLALLRMMGAGMGGGAGVDSGAPDGVGAGLASGDAVADEDMEALLGRFMDQVGGGGGAPPASKAAGTVSPSVCV